MKVETKQVITLTEEEKKTINKAWDILLDIMNATEDDKVYKATQKAADGIEELDGVFHFQGE